MARAGKTTKQAAPKAFLRVGCAVQGLVHSDMSQDEVIQWIDTERDYWSKISNDLRSVGTGSGVEGPTIALQYEGKLERLRTDVQKGETKTLTMFLAAAEHLEAIIGQSPLGSELQSRLTRSPGDSGFLYVALSRSVLSQQWRYIPEDVRRYANILGTMSGIDSGRQLQLAAEVSEHAKRIFKEATEFADSAHLRVVSVGTELDALHKTQKAFQAEVKTELDGIRKIYQSEVQTEEAANYWGSRALWARVSAFLAFALFVVLVGVPLSWGWMNFEAILAFATGLTAVGSSVWSLAPIILITIPALAYGWVLRHVSRLYVQSLTIADDASYRRTMAVTYLGLNKDPNSGITTQERAIILNALFRPAPPHTADDGPPTGLLDLIKKQA